MRCCAEFLASASHARFLAHALSHSDGHGGGEHSGATLASAVHACAYASACACVRSPSQVDGLSTRVREFLHIPGSAWRLAIALAFVLLFAAACAASAQTPPAVLPAAPAASLLDRIRDDIAGRWGVDAAVVRVEWSAPALAADLVEDAAFGMIGGGADGVWYVDVEGAEGRASRLRLRAGTEAVLPVAAHDLERAVTLTADDIAHQSTVVWGAPAAARDEVEAGWVTRRRIARGEVLTAPGVARPDAVKPGDGVRIVYVSGPVELVLAGRAAGAGAIGERVAVRAETGRRLEGVIVAPGTVRVDSGALRR